MLGWDIQWKSIFVTGLSSKIPQCFSIPTPCQELCLLTGTKKDSRLQNEEGWAQRPRCRWGIVYKRIMCERAECNRKITTPASRNGIAPHHSLYTQKAPSQPGRRCRESVSSPFSMPRSKDKVSAPLYGPQPHSTGVNGNGQKDVVLGPQPGSVGNILISIAYNIWISSQMNYKSK